MGILALPSCGGHIEVFTIKHGVRYNFSIDASFKHQMKVILVCSSLRLLVNEGPFGITVSSFC